jgi:hypothetical protein
MVKLESNKPVYEPWDFVIDRRVLSLPEEIFWILVLKELYD